ncbi:hydrogenase expression/formation protein HypE [Tautonia sociabilis]|uniref:Hydrogenase expression/formation protein HypE n=1 Tax=Tautonia sociabilis TaxID=2080755 RepID=A0A432MGD0_9BACT|nr:hydrogenase expression/formation protein HypE [Tautonia sociabilis]
MADGAGGKASRRLVEGTIVPLLGDAWKGTLADSAVLDIGPGRLAMTTDAFVVRPLRFPGGSIGELAVNGTVNDLAMAGAGPVALVAALVIEEGTAVETVEAELRALGEAAGRAGVPVVGGDTKVVEHGKGDGLYVSTTGLGRVLEGVALGPDRVREGDRVLLSGPIGDHGITILLARGEVDLEADLRSDSRPVWPLVRPLLEEDPGAVRWLRDPTRGGVASALNELARDRGLAVVLEEAAIPVREPVRGACELLGLDPLHVANEGQFLAVVAPGAADRLLDRLRSIPGGEGAAIVGTLREGPARAVLAETPYGGTRIVDLLEGDPLPRIC